MNTRNPFMDIYGKNNNWINGFNWIDSIIIWK